MNKGKLAIAISSLMLIVASALLGILFLTHKSKEAKVVTTIYPIYDIVRNIMGNDDDVLMLLDGGADMHGYQPSFQEITTLSKSELFIYIGGESDDKWVGDAISSGDNINLDTLSLMEVVNKLEENNDNVIQDDEHHHEGEEHNHNEEEIVYDEHIWLSIKNVIKMVYAIADKLKIVFPTKIGLIEENTSNYIVELQELDKEYMDTIGNAEKTMIITDKFPFLYLVNDYNLKYRALFSTCSSENTASFESKTAIIESIKEFNSDYVIVLENSSNISTAKSIIADCNKKIEIVYVNQCSFVQQNKLNNTSYIDLMTKNLEVFKKVLK
jgi:zinc transport system substrate-binding protein